MAGESLMNDAIPLSDSLSQVNGWLEITRISYYSMV